MKKYQRERERDLARYRKEKKRVSLCMLPPSSGFFSRNATDCPGTTKRRSERFSHNGQVNHCLFSIFFCSAKSPPTGCTAPTSATKKRAKQGDEKTRRRLAHSLVRFFFMSLFPLWF